jgi:hypothetical protein
MELNLLSPATTVARTTVFFGVLGREAMKVGERHGILYSSSEGEEEEFKLDEGVVFHTNIGENVP